jgi:opacity protein-like surface antigen
MTKKRTLGASALALACAVTPLLCASGSHADSLYEPEPRPREEPYYAPPPRPSWTGPYIGGHIGGAWSDGDHGGITVFGGNGGGGGGGGGDNNWVSDGSNKANIDGANGDSGNAGGVGGRGGNRGIAPIAPNPERRLGGNGGDGGAGGAVSGGSGNDDSFVGGLHLGYNWQRGEIVLGVEGDASLNGGMDNYLASLRGRLGLARDDLLFYVTGGLAFRDGDGGSRAIGLGSGGGAGGAGGTNDDVVDDLPSEVNDPGTRGGVGGAGGAGGTPSAAGLSSKGDDSDTGFVVGTGVEYKLSSNVSAGIEGLWYSFDDHGSGDSDMAVVRARMSFHLGSDESGGLKDGLLSAAVANWSGFYLGANAGAAFRDGNHVDRIKTANGQDGQTGGGGATGNIVNGRPVSEGIDDPGGGGGGGGGGAAALVSFANNAAFLGGAHIGYNWQSGARVFGIEGDADWTPDDFQDYLASARLRLGYGFGQTLVYGTAGVAFAGGSGGVNGVSLTAGGNGGDGQNGFQENHPTLGGGDGGAGGAGGVAAVSRDGGDDEVGFVVGGGVEVKLSERTSLGLEGLYYGFNGDDGHSGTSSFKGDEDLSETVVRGRLTFHLNGGEPGPLK